MEIKQGDIIQDDYSKDVWRVLATSLSNGGWLRAECLDIGDRTYYRSNYYLGEKREFPYNFSGWKVLPRKSSNFNELYNKLSEEPRTGP